MSGLMERMDGVYNVDVETTDDDGAGAVSKISV